MRVGGIAALVLFVTLAVPARGQSEKSFHFKDGTDHLDIYLADQRIARYLKRHPTLTRRALIDVTTPGGIQVTRSFPPRAPEDSNPEQSDNQGIDHPTMHPGIWIGFGDLNGNDYWRLRARVEFDGFAESPETTNDSAMFTTRNRYQSEDGEQVVCLATTRYQFRRFDPGVGIRIDATFHSEQADFYFGDQEESGLAVRVASPIRVQAGSGTILNDRGEINGAQVWGKEALWVDYYGNIGEREVGIMVVPSPKNPRPSWMHARDYGFVAANPFPKQPRERREPFVKTWVRRGDTFQLAYVILIHDLPVENALDRNAAYQAAAAWLAR